MTIVSEDHLGMQINRIQGQEALILNPDAIKSAKPLAHRYVRACISPQHTGCQGAESL
jgi:hypothetical protein